MKQDKIKENAKKLYNEVYKQVREKMYEDNGIPIKKRGGQQKIFKPKI